MEENKKMTIEEFAELLKYTCMNDTLEDLIYDIDSSIETLASELHTEIYKIDTQVDRYKEHHSLMETNTHENILDEIGYFCYFCDRVVSKQDEILLLKELRDKLEEEKNNK